MNEEEEEKKNTVSKITIYGPNKVLELFSSNPQAQEKQTAHLFSVAKCRKAAIFR